MTQTSRHIYKEIDIIFFFKLRFFIPLMLNRHRIMASGHDMCFWNWTLIFLLPEMFSSHTSLMCCLALAVFKSGWWSHFFFYVFEFTLRWIIVSNMISNTTSKSFCSAKLRCFKLVTISFQTFSVHNLCLSSENKCKF